MNNVFNCIHDFSHTDLSLMPINNDKNNLVICRVNNPK